MSENKLRVCLFAWLFLQVSQPGNGSGLGLPLCEPHNQRYRQRSLKGGTGIITLDLCVIKFLLRSKI